MAEYTYEDLLKLDADTLASLGFVRNGRGGISRIRAGIKGDEPPTLTQRGTIVPMNYDEVRNAAEAGVVSINGTTVAGAEQPATGQADEQPCVDCRGNPIDKRTKLEKLQDLAAKGKALLKGEATTGALAYLRAKTSSKVPEPTRAARMQLCSTCEERCTVTNLQLYRMVGGVPYCGVPRQRDIIRDEKAVGCGCDLTDKVTWWKASCPRGRWSEGPNMGPGAAVLSPLTREPAVLKDTIDVRSRTMNATDYTGIGDIVAALPVVHAIAVARDKRVRYRVIDARMGWAALGWPDVCMDREDTDIGDEVIDINLHGAIDLDKILEKEDKTRHDHWFERAGVEPFRPKLEVDPEGASWASEQLAEARRNGRQVAVLAPFANAPARQWPLHHWIVLAEKLLEEDFHVIMIDSDPQRGRFLPCQRYWGWKPTHVAALLRASDLYIGNDSGMTHLAGVFDVPSVAICSATWGKHVFGWYESVSVVQAPGECTGCLWREKRGHTRACLATCAALWNTSPEMVWDACMERIDERDVEMQREPAEVVSG